VSLVLDITNSTGNSFSGTVAYTTPGIGFTVIKRKALAGLGGTKQSFSLTQAPTVGGQLITFKNAELVALFT
jgi:hypothetical protein